MAKTETTVRGYVYTVTSPNGGTVTDAEGKLSKTVDAGDQVTVTAPSGSLTCDDDDAVICKANFKSPLLALRLLGQGENALPAGYTRVEFLESTGTQLITVKRSLTVAADCRFAFKAQNTGGTGWQHAFGARVTANTKEFGVTYNTSGSTAQVSLGGASVIIPCNLSEVHEIEADGATGTVFCGSETRAITLGQISMSSVGVFHRSGVYSYFTGRIFKASIFNNGQQFFQLVPALDPAGEPCMFDRVSKQSFINSGSGSFIAGVGTVAQLTTLLRRLPATGGELTLSLPAEANTPEVAEQLQACHDTKGWTLTVHEYRPAAVATYSLRRVRSVVWCRKVQTEMGSYVAADGTRWQVERCAAIFGALGQDPAAYCYTPFDSVEQAVEFWELAPYVDPNAEELTTEFES